MKVLKRKKKSLFFCPSFCLLFCYRVDLWNASNLKFGDEFLGELRLPLKFLRQSSCYEAWYSILLNHFTFYLYFFISCFRTIFFPVTIDFLSVLKKKSFSYLSNPVLCRNTCHHNHNVFSHLKTKRHEERFIDSFIILGRKAYAIQSIYSFRSCFMFLSFVRYFLQPRVNGNKTLKPDDLGSLRLNVVYTEDHVFLPEHYNPLRDLLLKSADVEVIFPFLTSYKYLSFYNKPSDVLKLSANMGSLLINKLEARC